MKNDSIETYKTTIIQNQFNFKSPGYLSNFGTENQSWTTLTNTRFTDTSLENHLSDKEVWGLSGGIPKTSNQILSRYIIIDIDNKPKYSSLEKRYSNTCDLLESDGVVFQSSYSGGLHVYFPTELLINESQLQILRSYCNKNDEQNQIEVYPSNKVLRLPLGSESYVLHWNDFSQPISVDKEQNIEIMQEYFDRSSRVSVPSLMKKIKSYNKTITYSLPKSPNDHNQSDWVSEGEYLYNNGLQSQGVRNESLLKVNTFGSFSFRVGRKKIQFQKELNISRFSQKRGKAMMIKKLFEKALSIHEPCYVKGLEFDEEKKQLNIHIDFKRGNKFIYKDNKSGKECYYPVHDTIEKKWRHLNFFEHECYLHCRTPRIKLPDGKVRLISPPWSGVNSGFTLLFEALILELCTHMPVKRVGTIIHETDDKLWRILEKYIHEVREQEDYSEVAMVGVDETSRAKGHDYISLFVDLKKKRTIFIADGKGSQTVEAFARDIESHNGKREQITDVSCDMSPAFIKGVRDCFPSAEITFDRFHILKIINEAVDKVRKEEVKIYSILTGKRYIFLKNNDNLTKKQSEQLAEIKLSRVNLKTLRALHIREAFQSIYQSETIKEFEILLKKWYWWATHSRIKQMQEVAHTIKRHWRGVLNWKISQITNGLLEGLNSLIQAAKSKARGYSSSKNFKIIAFLITGKLDFGKINPVYGTFK